MKRVYIVRGSEDGNLGVFSTIKKAYERAFNYATYNGIPAEFYGDDSKYIRANYRNVCKYIKAHGYCTLERAEGSSPYSTHTVTADIEEFLINDGKR